MADQDIGTVINNCKIATAAANVATDSSIVEREKCIRATERSVTVSDLCAEQVNRAIKAVDDVYGSITGDGMFYLSKLKDVSIGITNENDTLLRVGDKWINAKLNKSLVGLSNVDNTSDMDKPVSTAQREAIDKAIGGAVTMAEDSKKLGGRLAADYYHKENCNLPTVDWAAKNLTAAGDIIAKTPEAVVFTTSDVPGGSQYLHQLLDVEIPTPKNGDVLMFDGSKQKWVNISDVSIDAGVYAII